jgi:hypothetical protein
MGRVRMAQALVRAASAFLSTLLSASSTSARRPLPGRDRRQAVLPRTPLSPLPNSAGLENRCPVCQARFRGARICSRCGADLEPLMRLTVKAWQLRQAARQTLEAGDVERALKLATEAQGIQATGSGEALRLLGTWMNAV